MFCFRIFNFHLAVTLILVTLLPVVNWYICYPLNLAALAHFIEHLIKGHIFHRACNVFLPIEVESNSQQVINVSKGGTHFENLYGSKCKNVFSTFLVV
jgi:hypothetical protein